MEPLVFLNVILPRLLPLLQNSLCRMAGKGHGRGQGTWRVRQVVFADRRDFETAYRIPHTLESGLFDAVEALFAACLQSGRSLTLRQRPYRHGVYHRAFAGGALATKSRPDVPNGWQRERRASVIQPPAHRPWRPIASSAYCEQVGRCRQLLPMNGDNVRR
jgi:hypothetical protein